METVESPKAWIVPVWTKHLGGGPPMLICYVAGFSDPEKAREAVKAHIKGLEGDDVGEPAAISDGTADALDVKRLSVRML